MIRCDYKIPIIMTQCPNAIQSSTENRAERVAASKGWYLEPGVALCPIHADKEEVHRDKEVLR